MSEQELIGHLEERLRLLRHITPVSLPAVLMKFHRQDELEQALQVAIGLPSSSKEASHDAAALAAARVEENERLRVAIEKTKSARLCCACSDCAYEVLFVVRSVLDRTEVPN